MTIHTRQKDKRPTVGPPSHSGRRAASAVRTASLLRALLVIAAGLCCAAFSAIAGGESAPAIVAFSDGTVSSGDLRLIGSRPLTLVPLGENRQRMVQLSDLVNLEQCVETATMERPWVFKESGKAEKVYLEGEYPLINFFTRLTLVNGECVTGHVVSAALTFSGEDGKRKLFLQRQIKGTKEQKLADITYLECIRFTRDAGKGGGTIGGRVEGFGHVLSVSALDTQRGYVLFARTGPDNRFDFGNVLPGRYDLCVLTDTHALIGLSDAVPADKAGDTLQDGDQAGIDKKFPLADDFFNDRWIVGLRGNRSFAKALVYKRRADYHDAKRWTPGGFLWHLEVWDWHLADTEWKVDLRHILIRHKQKGGESNRHLLSGKILEAVTPDRELTIQADENDHETWHAIRDLD